MKKIAFDNICWRNVMSIHPKYKNKWVLYCTGSEIYFVAVPKSIIKVLDYQVELEIKARIQVVREKLGL